MALINQLENNKSTLLGEKLQYLEQFLNQGFPTKKDEEYKYTNLSEIVSKEYTLEPSKEHTVTKETVESLLIDKDFEYIVFVNGIYQQELSNFGFVGVAFANTAGISNFANSIAENTALVNLNSSFHKESAYFYIGENISAEKPIQLIYISQNQSGNTFYNTQNVLEVGKGSKVEIIETHYNLDGHFALTNSVTEIFVEANAKADWHKLQNDSETSYLLDSTFVKQERDSQATVNTFSFGGKLVRNNLDFIHNGENINSFMNGLTLIGNEQLVDHHTAVHHNQPNCESYQNYKGIYGGKSHGVFNGKVFVNKIAQKTNAYQQNNNVLLNEGATIDTKPQLEIFADDVKCSHGCTVGQMDEEALFYLRARGISKPVAQSLLLQAFADDALQNIDIPELKDKVHQLIEEKLVVKNS